MAAINPTVRAVALSNYLAECTAKAWAFDWQHNNCCHFAARWVQRMSGRDVMAGLPETPGPMAARRLVRDLGGSLAHAWTRQLGAHAIAPLTAHIGDLVLVKIAGQSAMQCRQQDGDVVHAMGICNGSNVAVLEQGGQVVFLPLCFATAAWRLPDPVEAEGAAQQGSAA